MSFDQNKLVADLIEAKTSVGVSTAENAHLTVSLTAATAQVAELTASVAALTAELAEAKEAPANPADQADYDAGIAFLTETLTKVIVASGEAAPAELPKTAAELSAMITEKTVKLTAILPVGGASAITKTAGQDVVKPALVASAFTNRNLGSN